MAHAEVKHDYHLVDPSPWPLLASLGVFMMALGGVIFMKGLASPVEDAASFGQYFGNTFLVKGAPWLLLLGLFNVIWVMIGWCPLLLPQ